MEHGRSKEKEEKEMMKLKTKKVKIMFGNQNMKDMMSKLTRNARSCRGL